MIVKSSTNQYPAILIAFPDKQHLKASPCPASIRQLSSGILEMAHISEAASFTCPISLGGGWG